MRRLIIACIVVVAVVTVTSIPTTAYARRGGGGWRAGGWPGPGVGLPPWGWRGLGLDQLGGLVDLEQAEVGAAGDREQDAVGAVDRGLEQRTAHGGIGLRPEQRLLFERRNDIQHHPPPTRHRSQAR